MHHRLLSAGLLGLLLVAGCGGSQKSPALGTNQRSKGFTKDDQSRCAGKGDDREVIESVAKTALQPNIRRVYQLFGEGAEQRRVLICREVDTNLDGVKDVVRVFTEKGDALREESDTDHDGKVDTWVSFSKGHIAKHERDTNGDGQADRWKYYVQGKLSRIQRDTNFDGKVDVWEIYVRGRLERMGVDLDLDGHVDRWDRDETTRDASATKEEQAAEKAQQDEAAKDREDDAKPSDAKKTDAPTDTDKKGAAKP